MREVARTPLRTRWSGRSRFATPGRVGWLLARLATELTGAPHDLAEPPPYVGNAASTGVCLLVFAAPW